jgi:hypothetical protein
VGVGVGVAVRVAVAEGTAAAALVGAVGVAAGSDDPGPVTDAGAAVEGGVRPEQAPPTSGTISATAIPPP